MDWPTFVSAVGLLFVFEGILPFLSPDAWRGLIRQIVQLDDRALRIMGLVSMLIGLAIVTVVHNFF